MSTVKRFEDLASWQLARHLANRIFELTNAGKLARTYSIRDQIQRAAVSIMANIAEGFERRSNKDFARFLAIAKASAAETRSLIYLAGDQGLVTAEERDQILQMTDRICSLLSRLRTYLLSK